MERVRGPQGHDDDWLMSRFRFPKAINLFKINPQRFRDNVHVHFYFCPSSPLHVTSQKMSFCLLGQHHGHKRLHLTV